MSKWLIVAWLDLDSNEVESAEARGPFTTDEAREDARTEIREDDPDSRVAIVPVDIEGDDDATLEIGDP